MSRSFDSLNGMESQSQPAMDGNSNIPVASSYAAILADELAQIERIVGHSIGKLKAVVEVGADAAKNEKAASEQIIAALRAEIVNANGKIAALEERANAAASALRAREIAVAQLEQASAARIADLETQARAKDALIADHQRQIGALKTELGRLTDGVVEMAAWVTLHAKALTDGAAPNGDAIDAMTDAAHASFAADAAQSIYPTAPGRFTTTLFDR